MNPEYPGNATHVDAWRYFTAECLEHRVLVPGQHSADIWPWFLAGWLAKAKQRDALRGRGQLSRRDR